MTGLPTSPSRLERNCPHPPETSSQSGQDGLARLRPADIRAKTTAEIHNYHDSREFLPHPDQTVGAAATPASASPTRAAYTLRFLADRRVSTVGQYPQCTVGRIPAEEA